MGHGCGRMSRRAAQLPVLQWAALAACATRACPTGAHAPMPARSRLAQVRILVKRDELTLEGIKQFYVNVVGEVAATVSMVNLRYAVLCCAALRCARPASRPRPAWPAMSAPLPAASPALPRWLLLTARTYALTHPIPPRQEREDWKLDTLCDLYETLAITQSVIFANTRRKVRSCWRRAWGATCAPGSTAQRRQRSTGRPGRVGERHTCTWQAAQRSAARPQAPR